MSHKTKADRAFESKRTQALAKRDFAAVRTVFEQYGAYLALIDVKVDPRAAAGIVVTLRRRRGPVLRYAQEAL
jgi:hypothetical protein